MSEGDYLTEIPSLSMYLFLLCPDESNSNARTQEHLRLGMDLTYMSRYTIPIQY